MESESDSTQIAIMWPLLKTIKYSTAIGHHASVISRSHTFFDSHAICRNYILSETKSLPANIFLEDAGHIFLLYFTEWGKDT